MKYMTSLLLRSTLIVAFAALPALGCSDVGSHSNTANGENGGASGAAGAGSGGANGDVSAHTYTYSDPNIVYSGRIQFQDGKAPRFTAPAVTISARFKGIGASMRINDNAGTANYFDVIIDDQLADVAKVKADNDGNALLAKDLAYGEHTIDIVRRTEANVGSVDFRSLTFEGEILAPRSAPPHKIEIIGDSISAGSGNEALNNSDECNEDYSRPYSSASKAWGPMLARHLNAEYQVTAVSGIGMTRNYNCNDKNTMPVIYDRLFVESASSPEYDHSLFVPDAVLIMIGTNDFSPAGCERQALNETVDPEGYRLFLTTLTEFVTKLRGYYPDAQIFLLASPMLNDGWPDATYTSNTSQRAAITQVADDVNAADGAGKLHVILPDYASARYVGRGCGTHPNVWEHGIIAGEDSTKPDSPIPATLILNPVKEVMGW